MHSVALYVSGNDEYGRMVRRTLMRYLNLTLILVLRSISSAVKRRFPTLEHLVEAGTVCRQVDRLIQIHKSYFLQIHVYMNNLLTIAKYS